MTTNKLPKGFSLQVNAGRYGGFYWSFSQISWRICLGWVAITLFLFDIEPVFTVALKTYNRSNNDY